MKVLVTGSDGFIGKNLCMRLEYADGVELFRFDKGYDPEVIESNIEDFDLIFHLAGVNRPDVTSEFYEGNTDLTQWLVSLIQSKGLSTPVVFTSSIQAEQDNDYGRSKRMAEDALRALTGSPLYIYRLSNVFGKWCKPNYNSVVATFCYNIAHGIPIRIDDPEKMLDLIYIDDVIDSFTALAGGADPQKCQDGFCTVTPVYHVSLRELADRLHYFHDCLDSIYVPGTGDVFTKKLFSTFISYAETKDMVHYPVIHTDERGSFTELIKNESIGQVSVSISRKGVTRGNHFHDTKMERFIVVNGKARITFKHVLTGEKTVFDVSGDKQEIVNIPVGYAHNIENIGDELILVIWGNEAFDPARPDTYIKEV